MYLMDEGSEFTTGDENVAIGFGRGEDITTGYYNTLLGYEAGEQLNHRQK